MLPAVGKVLDPTVPDTTRMTYEAVRIVTTTTTTRTGVSNWEVMLYFDTK